MITISRTFEWDMGHRVTNHLSLCKNPHGHRYKMIVHITGPMNDIHGDSQQGMVLDFGELKKLITANVVDRLDHSFMYWEEDDVMRTFADANKDLRLLSVPFVPTAENIVAYLVEEIKKILGRALPDTKLFELTVYETPSCKATWRE